MLKKLKLSAKFNVILAAVFLGGILLSALALNIALSQLAEAEVSERSEILLQSMNGVRSYTVEHVRPLLNQLPQDDETFISETVPAYSARQVINNIREAEAYNNFNYKEATINPTNPDDKADAFELGLIAQFQEDSSLEVLSGFRDVDGARVFYSARPMIIQDENCLACHSTPEEAPASLIATYGSEGGFGWELGEIVGTQIVYVPSGNVTQVARLFFTTVLAVVGAAFVVTMVASNFIVRSTVVSPVREIARMAQLIAEGNLEEDSFETVAFTKVLEREDELGQLGHVFRDMARQVHLREEQLKERVRKLEIVIDENKLNEQVDSITDTDYFRDLQGRASNLRERRHSQTVEQDKDEAESDV